MKELLTEAGIIISFKLIQFSNIWYPNSSIEVGKDADIVIYSGDPFDYDTVVDYVLINGEIVYKREGLK